MGMPFCEMVTALSRSAGLASDEKRKLIEEILINSVRRSKAPAARVQALRALEMIAAMPPAAALTFAAPASLQRESGSNKPEMFDFDAVVHRSGLPWFMNGEAVNYLERVRNFLSLG